MSGQSLSDLNRAALGAKDEQYWPIHWAAVGYTLLIGWFSVSAWTEAGEPFRAATCGGAQVLAIVCAVLARRALTGQMPVAGVLGLFFAGGCAWWAAQGVQHAWESNGTHISEPMIYFLAALEPGLFLLAEHVKEGRQALRAAHERDEREDAAEMERQRARDLARHGSPLHLAAEMGKAALGFGTILAPMGASASEQPLISSENTGHATARAHVEWFLENGTNKRVEIARRTKVPLSTVSRWCREWEAVRKQQQEAA